MHTQEDEPLVAGIDLGTTKVALVIATSDGQPLHTASRPHEARLAAPPGHAEQDAEKIIATAFALLGELPDELRVRVASVGVTGQMHGVVQHDRAGRVVSPLVTWQDHREAGEGNGGRKIPVGFGLFTLDWWARRGELCGERAATIHGLFAARLCGRDRAPIDPTDWQAWGGDPVPEQVPTRILPEPVGHGAGVGRVRHLGPLPLGIPVAAPLGDNQASLRATLREPDRELALTIGTGCQLSAVVGRHAPMGQLPTGAERRPYDLEHDLWVGAPRAGGAAWEWFARTVRGWVTDCGGPTPTMEAVYSQLDALGMATHSRLRFAPHLDGERWDSTLSASISGLRLDNGSLGELAVAIASGIIENAKALLPPGCLTGKRRVVGSGNALRRSALLRREAGRVLGLPIQLGPEREEAAAGAALVAAGLLSKKGSDGKTAD